jgi:hypothetical protein
MPLVGFILIIMALFAVGGALFMVMREHTEQEEWYIPPQPGTISAPVVTPSAQPGTTSVPTPVPPATSAVPSEPDTKTE